MFIADDARGLSNEWNWRDRIQMSKIKRKIKQRCKIGCRDLVLITPPNSKIVSKLRNEGYEAKMVCGFGFVIKWKEKE